HAGCSLGRRTLFLEPREVADERVDVLFRQGVLLHRRRPRRLRLGRHAFRIHNPGTNLVRGELAADAVELAFRVSLARNGMTKRALLVGEELLTFCHRVLRPGDAADAGQEYRRDHDTANHGISFQEATASSAASSVAATPCSSPQ